MPWSYLVLFGLGLWVGYLLRDALEEKPDEGPDLDDWEVTIEMDPNVITALAYIVALSFTKNGQPATAPDGTVATFGLSSDNGNLGTVTGDVTGGRYVAGEAGAAGVLALTVQFPDGTTVRDSLQILVGPAIANTTPDAVKMTLTVEVPATS